MNCKSYKAFSLLELIFAIFMGSIIIIYSTVFAKEIYEKEHLKQKLVVLKLDLNSAKIIIEKNLPSSINQLRYDGKNLYYKSNLLLENVTYYSRPKILNNKIKIELEVDNIVKQDWIFSL